MIRARPLLLAAARLAAPLTLAALVAIPRGAARATDPPPGVADFAAIAEVLLSPRCMNCHPAGDAPLVGDRSIPHRMNISRASPEAGLPCTSCHRDVNFDRPHAPPGAPDWRLPPKETPMVFQGRTPRQICEALKDPKENGGRALAALEEHFESEPLVLWAWSPGPGRTLPPIPHAELVRHVKMWVGAGGPCP